MSSPQRYCLLDCEDAEKWRGHEKVLGKHTKGCVNSKAAQPHADSVPLQIAHDLLHSGATWDHFKVRHLQH
jgi:hypothetical protein